MDRIRWSVERDDSFRTLPFSLFFICIFIFLVISHLKVWERQQVERGLGWWMQNYGGTLGGPYISGHVVDIPTAFDWMRDSGLPAVLSVCKNATDQHVLCHIGTRSTLLSDISLSQTR